MTYADPLTKLAKVGPEYYTKLKANDLITVLDLLRFAPYRYDDLRVKSTTKNFCIGSLTYFEGVVDKLNPLPGFGGKRVFKGFLTDESGSLPVLWFNNRFVLSAFKKNQKVRMIGKVEFFSNQPTLMMPSWESVQEVSPHIGRIVPIYHEFNGVTTKWLRSRIWDLLVKLADYPQSLVPEELQIKRGLLGYDIAYKQLHFPGSFEEVDAARARLAYEEMFEEMMRQHLMREYQKTQAVAAYISLKSLPRINEFYEKLPFKLSESQQQVIGEMFGDMTKSLAMRRMLIGDVGSGKTVVAAALMAGVREQGFRSVVMAPTQILAQQHYLTLRSFLSSVEMSVALVEGGVSKKQKMEAEHMKADVVVGTHALLHRDSLGEKIGLVVVDEQHRFGVNQRERLSELTGGGVHFLSMTATPIPRSLSLLLLGHLDVSYLSRRQDGRRDSTTKVVPYKQRLDAYKWAQKYVRERGGQIFVVCPFITPSEDLESVKAATSEFEYLSKKVFVDLRVELLHGGMKTASKEEILERFRNGEFEVLVTTPVVEVGIDIPNANFIIIESAERFGLAQLHQLRGRIGRAGQESFCFLLPTDENNSDNARLQALTKTHDGFELAEADLVQRGSGTVFGTLQSGFAGFKFANIEDVEFLQQVREDVEQLVVNPVSDSYQKLEIKLSGIYSFGRH